jgi:hypothetical protein
MKLSLLKSVAVAALMAHPTTAAFTSAFVKEEDLDAFLAKDEPTRDAEILAFAKAKKMPYPDAEDAKDGGDDEDTEDAKGNKIKKADPTVAEMIAAAVTKALEPLQAELKKAGDTIETLQGGVTTATLQKRAEVEFSGLGLGAEKTVSLLKACAAMPEDQRTVVEDLMKAHAELSAKVAKDRGVVELASQDGTASGKLQKLAIAKATEDKIPLEAAIRKISEDPAHAELVALVDAEEQGMNRAA